MRYDYDGTTLTVYAGNRVNEKLLQTDKNRRQITAALPPGTSFVVAAGHQPTSDPMIAQLSGIIGNIEEVEVTGVFGDATTTD
jgi:hypothetical protein